jgi:hypothetical protein
MRLPSSIGYRERIELHVGEVDLACRGNFLIKTAVAQVTIADVDRTVVHALKSGNDAAARMTPQ